MKSDLDFAIEILQEYGYPEPPGLSEDAAERIWYGLADKIAAHRKGHTDAKLTLATTALEAAERALEGRGPADLCEMLNQEAVDFVNAERDEALTLIAEFKKGGGA
jgi:hypothetical protein